PLEHIHHGSVEGDVITDVGQDLHPQEGEAYYDLGEQILMPGLINAHCHLDYTEFKGSVFPGKGFSSWIKSINAIKSSFSPEDYVAAIQKGIDLSLNAGCTSIFNIEAFPDLLLKLPVPPLRIWWFLELIDVRSRMHSIEDVMGAFSFFENNPDWLGGFGLSPHAPYTSSIELYRLAKHCAEELNMPVTTHIAESNEEQSMFLHAEGPLYEFLKDLGRNTDDCGHGSPLSHLFEFGLIPEKMICVHLNYLQDQDWEWIQAQPLTIVHCPKCHTFFEHQPFEFEALKKAGCKILLGTDSMASNDGLDLRSECRMFRESHPDVSAEELIKMITCEPAAAIGLNETLGVLRPGALADLVSFPDGHSDPYEGVIQSKASPGFVMVNGKMVRDVNTKDA
ncbi:MAG: amidohydrolase family protein, partial [Verrucomicrobiota bacterium]